MANLKVEISDDLRSQLAELAVQEDRNEEALVTEAIEQYLADQAWQIKEIRLAIAEADAGDFVDEKEIGRIIEKYTE
ncbi:MAG: hypothetical protein HYV26_03170 [Candidatus Hydrogenedentes bacterium]|nr:hypothetical protein [Candidatus Hydrogenedentota bacterium]